MGCSVLSYASHIMNELNYIAVGPTHQLSSLWCPFGGLEATHSQKCHVCCSCGLPYLTGLLVDLACSLLGRMDVELVLSCDHLPCLLCKSFPQLLLICCQIFNLIFVQVWSFDIHDVMPLWCESRNRDWNRMGWRCLLPVSTDLNTWVSQVKLII
jgi:hypothetical protein